MSLLLTGNTNLECLKKSQAVPCFQTITSWCIWIVSVFHIKIVHTFWWTRNRVLLNNTVMYFNLIACFKRFHNISAQSIHNYNWVCWDYEFRISSSLLCSFNVFVKALHPLLRTIMFDFWEFNPIDSFSIFLISNNCYYVTYIVNGPTVRPMKVFFFQLEPYSFLDILIQASSDHGWWSTSRK